MVANDLEKREGLYAELIVEMIATYIFNWPGRRSAKFPPISDNQRKRVVKISVINSAQSLMFNFTRSVCAMTAGEFYDACCAGEEVCTRLLHEIAGKARS